MIASVSRACEDALSTSREIEEAWMKMTESQIAAGIRLTDEEIKKYQELKAASREAAEQLKKDIEGVAEETTMSFEEISKHLSGFGMGWTALVSAELTGLVMEASHAADEFDEVMDTMSARAGKTGEALEQMGKVWEEAMVHLPVSAKQAQDAVMLLTQRLDLTGPALEEMTTAMLRFSYITGTSVASNVVSLGKMFKDWQISTEDQGEALNYLFKASQQTGVGVGTLASTVTRMGPIIREFKLGFEDAVAMVASMDKAGVPLQRAIMGMQRAMQLFAKSGKEPEEAFKSLIATIKNTENSQKALELGMKAFGSAA